MSWFYRDNDIEVSQTADNYIVKFIISGINIDVPKTSVCKMMGSSINYSLIKGYALCLLQNNF